MLLNTRIGYKGPANAMEEFLQLLIKIKVKRKEPWEEEKMLDYLLWIIIKLERRKKARVVRSCISTGVIRRIGTISFILSARKLDGDRKGGIEC